MRARRADPVVTARNRIATLVSEADKLTHELKAAEAEAVRLGTDPFATPAALERANTRLAMLTGFATAWTAEEEPLHADDPFAGLLNFASCPVIW